MVFITQSPPMIAVRRPELMVITLKIIKDYLACTASSPGESVLVPFKGDNYSIIKNRPGVIKDSYNSKIFIMNFKFAAIFFRSPKIDALHILKVIKLFWYSFR
jgi:hypothetical protein